MSRTWRSVPGTNICLVTGKPHNGYGVGSSAWPLTSASAIMPEN